MLDKTYIKDNSKFVTFWCPESSITITALLAVFVKESLVFKTTNKV
jgi:hypothetical protein